MLKIGQKWSFYAHFGHDFLNKNVQGIRDFGSKRPNFGNISRARRKILTNGKKR